MKNQKRKIKNGGFVLLFALLVSSILLATGLGISRLMVRQISLASLSRESQTAFFAADSGMECALHWETFLKFDITSTPDNSPLYCNGFAIQNGGASTMAGANNTICNAGGVPPQNNIINGSAESCFTFSLGDASKPVDTGQPCTFVVIDKSISGLTKITSSGYNKCSLSAPNVLQRTLEITLYPRP